ncbi:Phr family secreted Rap phosphatase inhibitor [Bacillus cereus group sp. MYBK12-2]|nr:Phr family secreted Rap phosphatase inhibitor [Bacillus pacificus]HDR7653572.1 Phr family secreted Rap phosphatase inhibitor [Bacillus pacificus]
MKKVKLCVLGLITVAVVSFGLNSFNSKEQAASEIQHVIPVQYEHGRGI